MLVLTRKPGQSIVIGDGIEVQVLSTAGERVRLGITAPSEVPIVRDEIRDRMEGAAGDNGAAPEARFRTSARPAPRT